MPIRQGTIDLGDADADRLQRALGRELRQARMALGLSQRAVARAARLSASRVGRVERAETRDPSLLAVCRVARVLGLSTSITLFPAGSPVRDAGQLRLASR